MPLYALLRVKRCCQAGGHYHQRHRVFSQDHYFLFVPCFQYVKEFSWLFAFGRRGVSHPSGSRLAPGVPTSAPVIT